MPRLLGVLVAILLVFRSPDSVAGKRKIESGDGKVDVGGERPFDAVNIFGDLGRSVRLPDTDENKLWWERMARGEVGRDRFLILCALKDGNWTKLRDIRNFVEFQTRELYSAPKLHKMLVLMAGRPNVWYKPRNPENLKVGEGWLEKNREADFTGIDSEWRIAPSVLPLLFFLLMGCPEDNRCE